MIAMVLVFAALAAVPARAQKPSEQLCALTNCSGIDFGRYRGAPTIERPVRERCPECECESFLSGARRLGLCR